VLIRPPPTLRPHGSARRRAAFLTGCVIRDDAVVQVHLIDGTYELFRHHMGLPAEVAAASKAAATRGVLRSVCDLLEDGATHVGVACDTVIESFRNDLWPTYKTGEGIEPALKNQFPVVERALEAMGVTVWGMLDLEADDALATAAARAAADRGVERVVICTPDKDLAQCVVGTRVVQLDRRAATIRDEDGVRARFGVDPASIPDYLALVGDSADGFPGLPGWGAKGAAAVLARWGTIEAIPPDPTDWDVAVRGAARLSAVLEEGREVVARFKVLATLVLDADGVLEDGPAPLRWTGPRDDFAEVCAELDAPELPARVAAIRRA
jgi:5'-3' exonuclease